MTSHLRYLDGELARLLAALERHPRFDEMLILITSDHGEGFGEHGYCNHGTTLYDEMLHVPMFVKPGRARPERFRPGTALPGPFQSVDIFPTVLAHAGVPIPPGLDGVAWGEGRDRSVAETWPRDEVTRSLQMVEQGGRKLIVSSDGSRELYDVVSDPGETRNLLSEDSATAVRLEALLLEARSLPSAAPSRDSVAETPEEVIRSLRALGYVR